MAIEYEVALNKLTTRPSYAPRVRPKGTISSGALIRRAVALSTVSTADAQAVLTALLEIIVEELSDGNSVVVGGLVQLTPTLSAKLPDSSAALPANATIGIGTRVDAKLVNAVRAKATLTRVEATNLSPLLRTVTATTGSLTALVGGNVLEIKGERLKFDPTKPDEGVFFVTPADSTIRVTTYLDNGDKRIRFIVPNDLTSTFDYTIEVRKRAIGSQTLRSGSYSTPVTAT